MSILTLTIGGRHAYVPRHKPRHRANLATDLSRTVRDLARLLHNPWRHDEAAHPGATADWSPAEDTHHTGELPPIETVHRARVELGDGTVVGTTHAMPHDAAGDPVADPEVVAHVGERLAQALAGPRAELDALLRDVRAALADDDNRGRVARWRAALIEEPTQPWAQVAS